MSSSSSPPPCGLFESADGSAEADSPVAGASEGAASAVAVVVADSLLAAGGGTGAAAGAAEGAGAGVGAGAWKAAMLPPISFRRKFAASASFLSHAKYAFFDERGKHIVQTRSENQHDQLSSSMLRITEYSL